MSILFSFIAFTALSRAEERKYPLWPAFLPFKVLTFDTDDIDGRWNKGKIWAPQLDDLEGDIYLIGMVGTYGTDTYGGWQSAIQVFDPLYVAPPDQWMKRYDDSGTGADKDHSIWCPACPSGFVGFGCIALQQSNRYESPKSIYASRYRCVDSRFASLTRTDGFIWKDEGSGGDYDGSMYALKDSEFFVSDDHTQEWPTYPVYYLDIDKILPYPEINRVNGFWKLLGESDSGTSMSIKVGVENWQGQSVTREQSSSFTVSASFTVEIGGDWLGGKVGASVGWENTVSQSIATATTKQLRETKAYEFTATCADKPGTREFMWQWQEEAYTDQPAYDRKLQTQHYTCTDRYVTPICAWNNCKYENCMVCKEPQGKDGTTGEDSEEEGKDTDPEGTVRCGTDWTDANGRCGTTCGGTDAACPIGEKCFNALQACSAPAPTAPISKGTLRCGVDWADANSSCGVECPDAIDSACPLGEKCFGALKTCVARSVVGGIPSASAKVSQFLWIVVGIVSLLGACTFYRFFTVGAKGVFGEYDGFEAVREEC